MKRLVFVFVGLSLLLLSCDLFSQTIPKRDVEVSASLNKTTCVVGEPVYLTFEFRSTTAVMKEFRTQLNFYGDVKIKIFPPERLPVDYRGSFLPTIETYNVFEIPPGKVERVSMIFYYSEDSPDGLIFDRPVKFPISLTLDGLIETEKVIYEFPPFQLEVKAPQDKDNQALSFLRKKALVYDIHQGRASRENSGAFETFLAKFPDSVYTPYVLYTVANGYMVKRKDKDADFPQAIELFKKYIERYPNTILTDDAVYKIGDCYNSLGDKKMAKQWLVKLHNEYSQSNRLNYYDPLMKEYIFIPKEDQGPNDQWMLYDTPVPFEPGVPGGNSQQGLAVD